MKVQGFKRRADTSGALHVSSRTEFKRRAHSGSPIIVHVGVGQRRRAQDVESPALLAARARSASIGAMDEMSQKVRKSEHTYVASFWYTFELISVASPPCKEKMPPPCQEKRARACSSGAMVTRWFDSGKLTPCHIQHTSNGQQKAGQWRNVMWKVQKANTPLQPDSSRRWCWSASPCQR